MEGARARVEVLGSFNVRGPAGADHLGGGLAAALVALLAVRLGQPVERDELVTALWATPTHDAGPALRQLVSRARRVLPAGAIERLDVGGRTSYRMSPDLVAVDLVEFDRLAGQGRRTGDVVNEPAAALGLVRGVPFSGLPALDAFDDARRVVEHRIGELRRALLLADAEACLPATLALLDDALRDAPEDEALWTAEVRLLARTGRLAAAARAAARGRRALGEVGIEPGPAFRLAERLAFDLGSMTPFQLVPLPPVRELVGREPERRQANALLAVGRRIVTIWGSPGIGSSSLLAVVVDDLVRGGGGVAYVRVPDAAITVEDVVSRFGWSRADGEPDRWISVVVPAGTTLAVDLGTSPGGIGESLSTFITSWPGPVVLAAGKPTGLAAEHTVHLAPLSHDDAVELLRRRAEEVRGRTITAAERDVLGQLAERAGGIPLVIELLARQLVTSSVRDLLQGPFASGLEGRIELILAELPPLAIELVGRLAWVDGPVDLVDAVRLFARPRPPINSVRDQLSALVGAGLVEFDADRPTSPYHVVVPIAASLRTSVASSPRSDVVARRAVTLAGRGRGWAAGLGRVDEAVVRAMLLDRLPELVGVARDSSVPVTLRRSLLRASAEAMVTVGRADEARRLLEAVDRSPHAFARDARHLVTAYYYVDDHRAVVDVAERVRHVDLARPERRLLQAIAARSLRTLGRFTEAHRLLDELVDETLPDDVFDLASLQLERGMVLVHEGRCDAARDALREARADLHALGIARAVGGCDVYLSWCAWADHAHDRAEELLRRAWNVAIELGHRADDLFCRVTAARFAVERGWYREALDDCELAEEYSRSARDLLLLARTLEVRSAAERGLGRPSDDSAFEAGLLRRRIQAPMSPFERRWSHGERFLTIAGL